MASVDISGLDKAAVLRALYNASRPLGMGFLQFDPADATIEECRQFLRDGYNFDYLKGRVMKVDISGNSIDPWGYDRDNGDGAAQSAIDDLRQSMSEVV